MGSTVIIYGDTLQEFSTVTFSGNVVATGFFDFDTNRLKVFVPTGAQSGPITISDGHITLTTVKDFVVGPAVPIPVVTATATAPTVTLTSSQPGAFTIALSATQPNDVLVTFTLSGTARNGVDYTFVPGVAKIKEGKTSKMIRIRPQGDLRGVSKRTVKLTLTASDGYTVSSAPPEKVKIFADQ